MSLKLKTGETIEVSPSETETSLQYSSTKGLPSLHAHLTTLQETVHKPPAETDIIITNGSQDALSKAFEMLLKRGSSLIVESPTYSGSLAFLDPLEINLVPIQTDELGLIPSSLESVLAEFDAEGKVHLRKPKVIYTIPTGSNPSGGTLSLDRKRRLYEIACEHDLIILEVRHEERSEECKRSCTPPGAVRMSAVYCTPQGAPRVCLRAQRSEQHHIMRLVAYFLAANTRSRRTTRTTI